MPSKKKPKSQTFSKLDLDQLDKLDRKDDKTETKPETQQAVSDQASSNAETTATAPAQSCPPGGQTNDPSSNKPLTFSSVTASSSRLTKTDFPALSDDQANVQAGNNTPTATATTVHKPESISNANASTRHANQAEFPELSSNQVNDSSKNKQPNDSPSSVSPPTPVEPSPPSSIGSGLADSNVHSSGSPQSVVQPTVAASDGISGPSAMEVLPSSAQSEQSNVSQQEIVPERLKPTSKKPVYTPLEVEGPTQTSVTVGKGGKQKVISEKQVQQQVQGGSDKVEEPLGFAIPANQCTPSETTSPQPQAPESIAPDQSMYEAKGKTYNKYKPSQGQPTRGQPSQGQPTRGQPSRIDPRATSASDALKFEEQVKEDVDAEFESNGENVPALGRSQAQQSQQGQDQQAKQIDCKAYIPNMRKILRCKVEFMANSTKKNRITIVFREKAIDLGIKKALPNIDYSSKYHKYKRRDKNVLYPTLYCKEDDIQFVCLTENDSEFDSKLHQGTQALTLYVRPLTKIVLFGEELMKVIQKTESVTCSPMDIGGSKQVPNANPMEFSLCGLTRQLHYLINPLRESSQTFAQLQKNVSPKMKTGFEFVSKFACGSHCKTYASKQDLVNANLDSPEAVTLRKDFLYDCKRILFLMAHVMLETPTAVSLTDVERFKKFHERYCQWHQKSLLIHKNWDDPTQNPISASLNSLFDKEKKATKKEELSANLADPKDPEDPEDPKVMKFRPGESKLYISESNKWQQMWQFDWHLHDCVTIRDQEMQSDYKINFDDMLYYRVCVLPQYNSLTIYVANNFYYHLHTDDIDRHVALVKCFRKWLDKRRRNVPLDRRLTGQRLKEALQEFPYQDDQQDGRHNPNLGYMRQLLQSVFPRCQWPTYGCTKSGEFGWKKKQREIQCAVARDCKRFMRQLFHMLAYKLVYNHCNSQIPIQQATEWNIYHHTRAYLRFNTWYGKEVSKGYVSLNQAKTAVIYDNAEIEWLHGLFDAPN